MSVAAILFSAPGVQAQQRPDLSKVEIKTTQLADNFYTLEGQGGTISVLTGPEGVLLVDSQFAPLTENPQPKETEFARSRPCALSSLWQEAFDLGEISGYFELRRDRELVQSGVVERASNGAIRLGFLHEAGDESERGRTILLHGDGDAGGLEAAIQYA